MEINNVKRRLHVADLWEMALYTKCNTPEILYCIFFFDFANYYSFTEQQEWSLRKSGLSHPKTCHYYALSNKFLRINTMRKSPAAKTH